MHPNTINKTDNLELKKNIDFIRGDYSGRTFSKIKFKKCTFQQCIFEESIFEDCVFENCFFKKNDAYLITFDNSIFSHCTLIEFDLQSAYLIDCTFIESNIIKCNLDNATCNNTIFRDSKSYFNTIQSMKIFLDGSSSNEWNIYEMEVRSFFNKQRAFKSEEQKRQEIEAIKSQIKITEYAASLGYHVIKKGKYYSLKEHDSVRIDADRNCFWRNSNNAAGSVIDFAVEFTHRSVSQVIQELVNAIDYNDSDNVMQTRIPKPREKQKLILPQRDNTVKNVYAYLLSVRQLNKKIVTLFLKEKYLYQDTKKNCIFVSYKNSVPVYAGKRGTNTNFRFIGDIAGSDYDWCFFIDNHAKTLICTESVIDLMSIMSILEDNKRDINNYDYLALTSTQKYKSIFFHEEQKYYNQIVLAFDNDNAGIKCCFNVRLHGFTKPVKVTEWLPKYGKDWNDAYRYSKTGLKFKIEVPI